MIGRLVAREDLASREREAMLGLLDRHFEGVERDQFADDLAEKNWVILIEDEGPDAERGEPAEAGRLLGFSTLLLYVDRSGAEARTVIYSGDTVVDPEAWNSSILSRTWIHAVKYLHRAHGAGALYWLLITSGFRTYRFLPVFWKEFQPRYDHSPLPEHRALLRRLASERFGARYDPETGVVRLENPQILREHLRGIPDARLSDPHVSFFARSNPGHRRGDELVCLTELSDENLTAAGRRMLRVPPDRLVVHEGVS